MDPLNRAYALTLRQSPGNCCFKPIYHNEVPFPELGGWHAHT